MKIYWWEDGDSSYPDTLWKKEGVHSVEAVNTISDLEQMIRNGYTEVSYQTAKKLGYAV